MNGIPYLSPDETREFIDSHPYTVILDIRTAREHREQRIPGSINLDFFELSPRSIGWLLPDKSRSVLVYCRAGLHSRSAAQMLRRCGYNAIDIGSVHDWQGNFEGSLV